MPKWEILVWQLKQENLHHSNCTFLGTIINTYTIKSPSPLSPPTHTPHMDGRGLLLYLRLVIVEGCCWWLFCCWWSCWGRTADSEREIRGSLRRFPPAKLKAFFTDSITLNLFSATVVVLYTSSDRDLYEAPIPDGMVASTHPDTWREEERK